MAVSGPPGASGPAAPPTGMGTGRRNSGPAGCVAGVAAVIVIGSFAGWLVWWERTHISPLWRAAAGGDLAEVRRLVAAGGRPSFVAG